MCVKVKFKALQKGVWHNNPFIKNPINSFLQTQFDSIHWGWQQNIKYILKAPKEVIKWISSAETEYDLTHVWPDDTSIFTLLLNIAIHYSSFFFCTTLEWRSLPKRRWTSRCPHVLSLTLHLPICPMWKPWWTRSMLFQVWFTKRQRSIPLSISAHMPLTRFCSLMP